MKKQLYILFAVLLLNKTFSQSESARIENEIKTANNCPFIFEATISNVEVFAGDKFGNKLPKSSVRWEGSTGTFYDKNGDEGLGYIKATLTPNKIYKGTLQNNSFEVIYKSVTIQNIHLGISKNDTAIIYMYVPPSHEPDFIILPSFKGQKYLFFCSNIIDLGTFKFQNNKSTESNINVVSNISFGSINSDVYASGFNKTYKTKEDLNTFLSSFNGINVNAKEINSTTPQKKRADVSENKNIEEILKQNNLKYEQWLDNHTKQSQNKQNNALAGTMNISMANPRIVDTLGGNWLEFDILMSASTSTAYFDSFLAHIQYNTSAFGTNMIANNNIVAIQSAPFTSPTYTNPNAYWADNGSNIVIIPFGSSNNGPYNRTLCSLTPQKLLSLRFKIQNCNVPANILFTNTGFTSSFGFYTPTAAGSLTTSIGFTTTNYSGTINDATCKPIITSFNNNIPAGVGRTLVINGRYFGKRKVTGTVILKNADKGTVYPSVGGAYDGGVQPYDVISWKDDEIKIKLPGVIDSVSSTGFSTPGTGKFQVRNFTNTKTESSSILTIPYAIYQLPASTPNYIKFNVQLSGKSPFFGYEVRCNPNVATAFPNAPILIKRALKEWSCNTGINWKLISDTTLGSISDGINMINVGSFSALQRTFREVKYCDLGGGLYRAYEKSFDIEINQTPSFGNWQVDSMGTLLAGNYDFYSAISHELGHGHLVEHINDSLTDIMWWAQYAQPFNQTNRKLVSVSPGAPDAGNYIVDTLTAILPCYGNHVLTFPQNCAGFAINIKKNGKDPLSVTIYPNPIGSNQNLYINFEDLKISKFSYQLIDITGAVVEQETINTYNSNSNVISIKDYPSGMYMLRLNIDGKFKTVKIIKE
jgi:hypothetical protein